MRTILIIGVREVRSMFLSPLAWTLLAILFSVCSYMFSVAAINYQESQLQYQGLGKDADFSLTDAVVTPTFGNAAVLFLLIMPLITMRLIAEEKRHHTWSALASSPLTPMVILLGKYLGLLFFLVISVGLLGMLPVVLFMLGNPDLGQILAGFLGLFLLLAAFGAVGLAASSSTDNPLVAALWTFGVLLSLWIISWIGGSGDGALATVLTYLSLLNHYHALLTGVVDSADLAYFVLLTMAGLLFARQRLMAERIRG